MVNEPQTVLVVPYWSQSDAINFDSNYSFLRQVIPEMSKLRPSWLWFVLWPVQRGADVWRYTPDGFFNEKIVPVKWEFDTQRSSNIINIDPLALKEIEEKLGPTIYWVQQVESATAFQRGYADNKTLVTIPTVVVQHHYTAHKSREVQAETSPSAYFQMIGCLSADRIVSNSLYAYRMANETFGLYLNLKTLNDIRQKTTVLPFGLVTGAEPKTRPYPKPVILYNHRFENYKQPETTANVLKALKKRFSFEVWITQTVGQRASLFPFDKAVGAPLRGKYLENIAVPAINTLNTRHETFCISALDSLSLGHILVAPRALAFPEMVPEGYPYLFDSVDQQYSLLTGLLKAWPRPFEDWSARLRRHARERFSLKNYSEAYAKILDEAGQKWKKLKMKEKTERTVERVYQAVKKETRPLPVMHIRHMVRSSGFLGTHAYNSRRVVREFGALGGQISYRDGQVYLSWSD